MDTPSSGYRGVPRFRLSSASQSSGSEVSTLSYNSCRLVCLQDGEKFLAMYGLNFKIKFDWLLLENDQYWLSESTQRTTH